MDFNNPNDYWHGYDPYKGMTDDERMKAGCLQGVGFIVGFFVALLLCILLGSCTTTKYVPVYHHTTDTLRITQHQRDSLYFCDSIYTVVRHEGDTVYHETDRWRIRYVERRLTDTVYQNRTDSVPVPYPVEKEVPAPLTWWQQTRLHLANVGLWVLLLCTVIWIFKRTKK